MTVAQPVLFYDGDCRFCRATARAVAALDRRRSLAILPFDDPAAVSLLASLPPDRRRESIRVVQSDGCVLSAGDALIELTRVLPGGGLLASAARRNDGLRRLFGRAYQLVADRRGTLSRMTPDGPSPIRRPSSP